MTLSRAEKFRASSTGWWNLRGFDDAMPFALFNLAENPGEIQNLAGEKPECLTKLVRYWREDDDE